MAEHNLLGNEKGNGGDVVFTPGRGYELARDGSFVFKFADGVEAFRLGPDGFFVRGVKQADDRLLYLEFRYWFERALVQTPPRKLAPPAIGFN